LKFFACKALKTQNSWSCSRESR